MAVIAGNGYATGFEGMFILAVASFCSNQIPAVLLNQFDYITYFHRFFQARNDDRIRFSSTSRLYWKSPILVIIQKEKRL